MDETHVASAGIYILKSVKGLKAASRVSGLAGFSANANLVVLEYRRA